MLTAIIEEIEQRFKFSQSRRDRQRVINVLEAGYIGGDYHENTIKR